MKYQFELGITDCRNCPCYNWQDEYCQLSNILTDNKPTVDINFLCIPFDCPLVEVQDE